MEHWRRATVGAMEGIVVRQKAHRAEELEEQSVAGLGLLEVLENNWELWKVEFPGVPIGTTAAAAARPRTVEGLAHHRVGYHFRLFLPLGSQ